MTGRENGLEIRANYLAELKEQLSHHIQSDTSHQGKILVNCHTCDHLNRMIDIIEKHPVRFYRPPPKFGPM